MFWVLQEYEIFMMIRLKKIAKLNQLLSYD
jgi:hypothetical protein